MNAAASEQEAMSGQIQNWMSGSTSAEWIRKHPRSGLDYIPWNESWRELKRGCPTASATYVTHWETEAGLHVIVRLSADGVVADGLGFEARKADKQITAFSDSGYKAAYSDAISRACKLFGIGIDLYDADDRPVDKRQDEVRLAQPTNGGAVDSSRAPTDTGLVRRRAFAIMGELKDQFAHAGVDGDMLRSYLLVRCDVESRADITGGQWENIVGALLEAKRYADGMTRFCERVKRALGPPEEVRPND